MRANRYLRPAVGFGTFYRLRDIQAHLRQTIVAFFAGKPAVACHPEAEERAARMFAQALYENSNLELDWLWYAKNMTGDAERRYCLERALAINPASDMAKQSLAKLPQPSVSDEVLLFARHVERSA